MKNIVLSALLVLTLFWIVRYFYFLPRLVYGEPAPVFNEKGIDDSYISLDQYKGKYLLIDFWGSWCGPCRKENKILPFLYTRYKDAEFKTASGFRILNVGLEDNKESGLNAIRTDQLNWKDQIIQTEMLKSKMAKLYEIKQIPFKYLIGPDSKIVLTNPDLKELDDFLAHNLKKN